MTISRRGFLTAMLASGTSAYVMSSGIGRGVLMPVREIIAPRPMLIAYGTWTMESETYCGEEVYEMIASRDITDIIASRILFGETMLKTAKPMSLRVCG